MLRRAGRSCLGRAKVPTATRYPAVGEAGRIYGRCDGAEVVVDVGDVGVPVDDAERERLVGASVQWCRPAQLWQVRQRASGMSSTVPRSSSRISASRHRT